MNGQTAIAQLHVAERAGFQVDYTERHFALHANVGRYGAAVAVFFARWPIGARDGLAGISLGELEEMQSEAQRFDLVR